MDSNLLSLPSSCSTSSTHLEKYDVFLSFRGEDTRHKFTDHLYTALVQKGIVTFRDDEKLERGKLISPELLQAIRESRFAIVILSENYASSTWCLDELANIIDCKQKLGMTVLPVFHYVDPSDVRKQKGPFEKAFDDHEKHFEEKIEIVNKWRDALRQVGELGGWHLKNGSEAQAIQNIVGRISRKLSYEFKELIEDSVGIGTRVAELESILAVGLDDIRFIGVWAMGGMGKTTLACIVYSLIFEEFEASFFANVREDCEKDGLLSLQKKFLCQILKETNLNIDNINLGAIMIGKRLRDRRILLVLDDVYDSKQLEMLAGKPNWFGPGSRIIITTREKDLLESHSVHKIFEVKPLNDEDASHLFCLKAFKKEHAPSEYLELSNEFLNYVQGLPLALEVLGSSLFGKNTIEWKSALKRLKEGPGRNVIQVFEISFDRLHDQVKEIFLYIACLFNHEEKNYVVEILHSLDLNPDIGLRELIDKSLLKISDNNKLWMHNLLGEMGRNIVRQEFRDEPWKPNILWFHENIDHMLKTNMGTEKVQAIDIRGAKETSIFQEGKEACWRPQGSGLLVTLQGWVLSSLSWRGLALLVTFQGWVQKTLSWQGFTSSNKQKGPLSNLPDLKFLRVRNINLLNLKFLRVRNINLLNVPLQLSNNLRYIEWSDYPSESLPYFQPNKLVKLHLRRSKIVLLWKGMKNFDKLKFIDLADSSNLIISPDFTGVPNLEKLVLARCSNLRQLHPSIGNLKKLNLLDLKQCKELSFLPDKFETKSLEILNLSYCSKVKKVPEFVGDMKCSKFDKLPEFLGNIDSLKERNLSEIDTEELPSSVNFLTGLQLIFRNYRNEYLCYPNSSAAFFLEVILSILSSSMRKI